MTNLLAETFAAITQSGHIVSDIQFIGSADGKYACTWSEFKSIADAEYHSGFGAAEVAPDLVIRFEDGKHLWRGEYDGSEWWEFDGPHEPWDGEVLPITKIIGGLWNRLYELNPEPTA